MSQNGLCSSCSPVSWPRATNRQLQLEEAESTWPSPKLLLGASSMATTVESSVQPAILQAEFEALAGPAAPANTPQKYEAAAAYDELEEALAAVAVAVDKYSCDEFRMYQFKVRRSSRGGDRPLLFECRTCSRRFASFQALGGHRTSHTRQQAQQRFASSPLQALGGHHRTSHTRLKARMLIDDDPAGITTNGDAGGGGGGAAQGSIAGGEGFTTGGGGDASASGTRGTTDQGGVLSSKDHVSLPVAVLEALLDTTRTAENNKGDDEGATVNAKKSIEQADPVDYTSPMVGVFAVAIALRASSIASYPVLEKALGPKLARLAYDFPWVLIFIVGVGLLVNVAFDRSARARIFGKYALLLAIAVMLCLATWFWSSLQI